MMVPKPTVKIEDGKEEDTQLAFDEPKPAKSE